MRHLAVIAEHGAEEADSIEQQSGADGPAGQVVVQLRDTGLAHVLDDVQRRLELVLKEGPRTLVVDMSAVAQVSSTTIAALLWIRRRCSARGIEVLLRRPSRRSLEALERVGLLGVLMVEPTDDSGRS